MVIMFDLHEKRRMRSWLYSKVTIGVVLILCLLMAGSVYKRYQVEREMAERRAETEASLNALEDRAAAIQEKVDTLENQRGLEAEIRDRFDVAREGEQVVIILDSEEEVQESAPVVPVEEKPWYKFW